MELQRWNTYHNLIARAQRGLRKHIFERDLFESKSLKMEVTKAISEEGGWSTWDLQMRETGIVIAKTANKASLWCVKGKESMFGTIFDAPSILWSWPIWRSQHSVAKMIDCWKAFIVSPICCIGTNLGQELAKKNTFQYYITCCHFHWRTWIKCQSSGKFDKKRPSVGHFARLECGSVGTTSLDLSPLQTNLKKRPWREKMCIWNELALVGEFFLSIGSSFSSWSSSSSSIVSLIIWQNVPSRPLRFSCVPKN